MEQKNTTFNKSSLPIKALLLAAGFGTRLRPLTANTPKCMVSINGKPLLEDWLDKLEQCGCRNTTVNTHYLAEKVENFLNEYKKKKNHEIRIFRETNLLGTAGTLRENAEFFKNSTGLVIHSDNVTDIKLEEVLNAHKERPNGCIITMVTFTTDKPQSCGIVKVNSKGIMTGFKEKPSRPEGNKANGAIYVISNEFFETFGNMSNTLTDFSSEILPRLVGKTFTYHTSGTYIDIGTRDQLEKARKVMRGENK